VADRAAPLAIWLGLLLDGFPESFVIGAAVGTRWVTSRAPLVAGVVTQLWSKDLYQGPMPSSIRCSGTCPGRRSASGRSG
jgi:hypothetical protein